ncbi:MAG: FtsX-like permease family protein [Ruminococcus sp.]|nr:FtsX-like permease family protein [Ruminococcus sp.]
MKTALYKDTAREIRRSLSRFLSILAIIALGCGFFAGVKATMPDMVSTAEDYFKDKKLMDAKLVSSVGFKSEDVQAVRHADGVKAACPGYSADLFYYYNEQNVVLKFMSLPDNTFEDQKLNTPTVLEGRLPEKAGECAVEVKMNSPDTFKVGEKLVLTSPYEDKDISEILSTDSFEIVGIVTSPLYIGYERDNSNVGSGKVLAYVMVNEESFVLDYYSELFIDLEGLEDLDPFSDEYKDAVAEKAEPARQAFEASVKARYDSSIKDAQDKLEKGQKDIDKLEKIMAMSSEELSASVEKLENAQKQLDQQLDDGSLTGAEALLARAQLIQLNDTIELLRERFDALESGDTEKLAAFTEKLDTAKNELEKGKADLAAVPELKILVQDRFTSTDYASFRGDADKIDAIAKVFPAFFILIAALVTLTTMTRMVEEHRIQIGSYKALGYSSIHVISKYLVYAFLASVIGSVIGTVIGLQVFPKIIYDSYKIMYNIPKLNTPFRPWYLFWCMLASVLCTGLAVIYASLKTLRAQPSQLMRPAPPASGRRVALERIGFIWNRLGFLMKVTVRNLLRYKKRFFMTLFGVAGCTALIITGFGLKHSISTIADKQFGEIFDYSATVVLSAEDNASAKAALNKAESFPEVDRCMLFSSTSGDAEANGTIQSVNLVVPKNADEMKDYVNLRSVSSDENLTVGGSDAIITEKLSMMLSIGKGDSFTLELPDKSPVELKVKDIAKNYALHYVYISEELYSELYSEEPLYKMMYVNTAEDADESAFKEKIVSDSDFLGISYKNESSKGFLNSVDSLDSIVLLLIFCAGLLAIIVLYNLANINITERVREIATIKVLGFSDGETSAYIFRENVISAIIGMLIGLLLGKILHYFVVITSEVDIVLFNRELVWWAYLFGVLITALFTGLVNLVLHFRLRRIDMVESLKSVE